MRRLVLAVACLAAAIVPSAPVTAGGDARWVAFVRGSPEEFIGSLEVVRTDGSAARTLIDDGVLSASVGPDGIVYAAWEEEEATEDQPFPASSLVRVPATGGTQRPVVTDEGYYLSVAASSRGDVAFFRSVTRKRPPPEYIEPAIEWLRDTNLPVLVPPEEPPDTGHVVGDAGEDFYVVRFTNDLRDSMAHAEQVNFFVEGTADRGETPEDGTRVRVRGSRGQFFCGASACFLTWRELGATYTVGEFGDPDQAVEFAEALVPMEEVAGFFWQSPDGQPVPELIVAHADGDDTILESIEDFCECGFPIGGWNPNGRRLLVVLAVEGDTILREYRMDGSRGPREIDTSALQGDAVLDAAYAPDGIVVLMGGEGGPPGFLQTIDGEVLGEQVRAFDIQGRTLALVTDEGDVIVRDLESGQEQTVGQGAIDVSLSPDTIPERPAGRAQDRGFPMVLFFLLVLALVALLGGASFVLASRRRRG